MRFHHITRCFKNIYSFTQSRRLVSLTVVKCTMCMYKEVIQACPYALINVRPHYHIHELKAGIDHCRCTYCNLRKSFLLFSTSPGVSIVRPADGNLSANLHLPHTRVALHYGAATAVKVSQLEVFSIVNSQAIISLIIYTVKLVKVKWNLSNKTHNRLI